MGDQGQTVKSSLWARSCFPINGYIISLSYFADTETPSRRENLMINNDMLTTSMLTPDQLDLKFDDADYYLPH